MFWPARLGGGRGKDVFMRWLMNSVLSLGMFGGLATMAGGCDYDDHDYHHDRYYRERPVVYRGEPERRWEHDRDWDRRYDRHWDDREGRWHEGRW
jgi:hypothetical protein